MMTHHEADVPVTNLPSRVLTFGGTVVKIEYTDGRAAEIVDFLFERIPRAPRESVPQARLSLTEDPTDGVFTLTNEDEVCCVDRSAGAVASWLLHVTCGQIVLAGASADGLLLHAAAVAWEGRGLLIPGASGCGKSTLTAFLTSGGFDYLTDELTYVPLEAPTESVWVEGLTAPMKIKKSGIDAVEERMPLSTGGRVSLAGVHDVLVRPGADARGPVPLSVIIFPRYEPDSEFRLEPLSPAQTGLRLMAGALNGERLPDHGFRAAARVASLAPGYALRYASLAQVEPHVAWLRHASVCSVARDTRAPDVPGEAP